jgi:putative transposase
MNKRRKFSPQFKSQVVLQLLSSEKSMAELRREHQLTAQMIGNWKQQFLAAATQAFEGDAISHAEQERIAELELSGLLSVSEGETGLQALRR